MLCHLSDGDDKEIQRSILNCVQHLRIAGVFKQDILIVMACSNFISQIFINNKNKLHEKAIILKANIFIDPNVIQRTFQITTYI